jgi:hypothetical protein
MTYTDFNRKVLAFYIERAKTSFCSFSLDQGEFELLVDPGQVASFEILKNDWTSLIQKTTDIPLYFGLIALQCFAATQMEDGDNVTDSAYIYRFSKLVGLNVSLQQLFKSPIGDEAIQEKIWHDAKLFLKKQYGLRLEIPNHRFYKGRYVQYPLSQLLLKTEDLKDFTPFFFEHFLPNEDIPLDFFQAKLQDWLPRVNSRRAERLLNDPIKRNRCYEQLFNYFQSWTGEVFSQKKLSPLKPKNLPKPTNNHKEKLILVVNHAQYNFFFKKNNVSFDKVFNLTECHYFHRGLILFNPSPNYDSDFENSRFLYLNSTTYLLVDRQYKSKEYHFLDKNASNKCQLSPGKTLFLYSTSSITNTHPLRDYFYRVNPVFLKGGIKLDRTNLFLSGFGPIIDYSEKFMVLFENRPIEYNPKTALPGDYKVRVTHFRDIPFSIVNVSFDKSTDALSKGWDFHTMLLTERPMLEGCLLYSTEKPAHHPIRGWINANLGKPVNKKDRVQNSILITLEYARRTKRKR